MITHVIEFKDGDGFRACCIEGKGRIVGLDGPTVGYMNEAGDITFAIPLSDFKMYYQKEKEV